jgi:hypothetical protein
VDRARLTARAILQVDAGDVAPSRDDEPGLGEAADRASRTALALRAYRRMGVDAITVGERDHALGPEVFKKLCDDATIPVVAANLLGSDARPLFPASKVLRAGALAVGVFGVLDVRGESWTPPAGVTVTDAAVAARAAVAALRAAGARLVIGLLHVSGGLARAKEIAAAAGGIDIVVFGHDGPAEPPRFVWPGPRGATVGQIDVRVRDGDPGGAHLEDHLVSASPNVTEQLGVHLLVRVASGPIAATFDESVAAMAKSLGHRTYGENWTYNSTGLCVGCHTTQAAQWRTTDHAHAFATLKAKGHDREPLCIGCHMTGFLLPGGPQNFETATTQFTDVGCEACHGPSVEHVVSVDKHKGTSRRVDPGVCLGCHTPDQNLGDFVVAEAMKEIVGPGHGLAPAPPH